MLSTWPIMMLNGGASYLGWQWGPRSILGRLIIADMLDKRDFRDKVIYIVWRPILRF